MIRFAMWADSETLTFVSGRLIDTNILFLNLERKAEQA